MRVQFGAGTLQTFRQSQRYSRDRQGYRIPSFDPSQAFWAMPCRANRGQRASSLGGERFGLGCVVGRFGGWCVLVEIGGGELDAALDGLVVDFDEFFEAGEALIEGVELGVVA